MKRIVLSPDTNADYAEAAVGCRGVDWCCSAFAELRV
jgi:hypothetical protein